MYLMYFSFLFYNKPITRLISNANEILNKSTQETTSPLAGYISKNRKPSLLSFLPPEN